MQLPCEVIELVIYEILMSISMFYSFEIAIDEFFFYELLRPDNGARSLGQLGSEA